MYPGAPFREKVRELHLAMEPQKTQVIHSLESTGILMVRGLSHLEIRKEDPQMLPGEATSVVLMIL